MDADDMTVAEDRIAMLDRDLAAIIGSGDAIRRRSRRSRGLLIAAPIALALGGVIVGVVRNDDGLSAGGRIAPPAPSTVAVKVPPPSTAPPLTVARAPSAPEVAAARPPAPVGAPAYRPSSDSLKVASVEPAPRPTPAVVRRRAPAATMDDMAETGDGSAGRDRSEMMNVAIREDGAPDEGNEDVTTNTAQRGTARLEAVDAIRSLRLR